MLWRYNIADMRDIKKPTEYFGTEFPKVVPGAGLEPALRLREKGF